MKVVQGNLIFTLLLLIFVSIILLNTEMLGPVAAMIPRKVVLLTFLLLLIQLTADLRPVLFKKFKKIGQAASVNAKEDNFRPKVEVKIAQLFPAFLWILLVPMLIFLIGFVPFAALYIFFFLKIRGKEPWLKSLAIAVTVCLILLVLFNYLPGVTLYQGKLLTWLVFQK